MKTINPTLAIENATIQTAYDKHGKFYRDYNTVKQQFENLVNGDDVNYMAIIKVLADGIAYHKSGKIEGCQSLDSTSHCEFCSKMRTTAANHPENEIICGKCYDYAQETSYRASTVLPRHWLNMKILSIFDLPVDLLKFLPIYTPEFRFNSSGDIENVTHAKNLINIAYAFNHIQFGLWTKNQVVVDCAFNEIGKPENVRYIQSVYSINGKCMKSKYADLVFTVFDKDHIIQALANGCNECNGKKCAACSWSCYRKPENGGWETGTEVAEVLRNV